MCQNKTTSINFSINFSDQIKKKINDLWNEYEKKDILLDKELVQQIKKEMRQINLHLTKKQFKNIFSNENKNIVAVLYKKREETNWKPTTKEKFLLLLFFCPKQNQR